MDAWYPKINSRGNVVSGSGNIYYRNSYKDTDGRHIAGGWSPAFLDMSWLIFNNGATVSTYDLVNNKTIVRPNETYSVIVAAVGNYIGWLVGNITFKGATEDGVGPSISKSGINTAWLTPYQAAAPNYLRKIVVNSDVLAINGKQYSAAISEVSISDKGLVWSENDNTKIKGILGNGMEVRDITVRGWEVPLICDTPDGPWIISKFQDGLGARPFLSQVGQFFPGVFHPGDAIWLNNRIVIVGSSDSGQPLYYEVDIDVLNVDLTKLDDMPTDFQPQIDQLNARVSTLETKVTSHEHQINDLNAEVSSLQHRVDTLESSKTPTGSKLVAIKSSRGKYLRDDWDDSLGHFDRDTPGGGEQYTLEPINGGENFPNPPVDGALTTSGKFFLRNGQIHRIKRFTSFKLLNVFESGNAIGPILDDYKEYNSARIFCYTGKKDWGNESWDFPDQLATMEFLLHMEEIGFDVELVLITDDDFAMVDKAKKLVEYLSKNPVSNLMLEAVNEPFIHDKIDPGELKNALSNSPYLYSSGVYTDNRKFYGKYWNDHSSRDSEWWRKGGHNLMEAYNGGGPNFPDEPALRMPGVEDEPIKPNEAGYDLKGFYEYAASCGLMGAGATFHSESGKFSRILTLEEATCRDHFIDGLNMYPLDAANGQYRRIDESETGRTYVVGNYAIRIHQEGNKFPESGWTAMDNVGVCWKR